MTMRSSTDGTPVARRRRAVIALCALLLIGVALVVRQILGGKGRAWETADLESLKAASATEPDNPKVWFSLAHRQQEAQRKEESLKSYAKAAELAPDDAAVWLDWAQAAESAYGPQPALLILRNFLKDHPTQGAAHREMAALFQRTENHSAAFAEAKAATAALPDDALAWTLYGAEAGRVEQWRISEEAFRKALALAPADWRSHTGLGESLFFQSKTAEAIAEYREATTRAPQEGTGYVLLGRALLHEARTPEQIESARQALLQGLERQKTLPRDAVAAAYRALGDCYGRQGRWNDAQVALSQAIVARPGDPAAHYALAQAYRRLGRNKEAEQASARHRQLVADQVEIRALSQKVDADANDTDALERLAKIFVRDGEDAKAILAYRFLVYHSPNVRSWRDALNDLLARQQQQKGAAR